MAIGFARLEFVKRSSGKNACAKSAYNARTSVHFHGNDFQKAHTYNWSHHPKPLHHEILLPPHTSPSLQHPESLWNLVEAKENRLNSVTANELVLALPDDTAISHVDRIHLAKTFIHTHFISKGFAAQLDIHIPSDKEVFSEETGKYEKVDHNYHAHILTTTRRFKENGHELEDNKPREYITTIRGGKVISGPNWGKLWAEHQNLYFEEKGLSLRVDPSGIIPQKHLGPTRMRGRAFSLLHEHETLVSLNVLESQDPTKILNKITETKSVFTKEDVDAFLQKHVPPSEIDHVRTQFWQQKDLVPLLDQQTHASHNKFSSKTVLQEEHRLAKLADRLVEKTAFPLNTSSSFARFASTLTPEQHNAFTHILQGQRLSCIEGHAGTGKSYLLLAIRNAYQSQGYIVRAFGPDSATAAVLKEKGFESPENIYQFLFAHHHDKRDIKKNKEVWIIDEAGKLGNRPLLEFLKIADKQGAQLILSGNSAQLPSVERGGMFKTFCQKYGAHYLIDIQRQKTLQQKEMTQKLAHGDIGGALDTIAKNNGLHWENTKEQAMESLILKWAQDRLSFPSATSLIIAHSNAEVKVLNELVRLFRKEAKELGEKEYLCQTTYGKIYVSTGDTIEFRKNSDLGVTNGMQGTLIQASENNFSVQIREGEKTRTISFNPTEYTNYHLGYATTYHRSQGRTVDRAYVLHSPQLNKEKFYVGLTRHTRNVELFLSKTHVSCIADLKRQLLKTSIRESTLDFSNPQEVEKLQKMEHRKQEIATLKTSSSLLAKMKGNTLSLWDEILFQTHTVLEHVQDRRPDAKFFNPQIPKNDTIAEVTEIQYKNSFKTLIEQKAPPSFASNDPQHSLRKKTWEHLPENAKSLLRDYYSKADQATSLRTIVQSEAEMNQSDEKNAPHFSEWQNACVERNKQAHLLLQQIPPKLFSSKSFEILQERAHRYEISLQKKVQKLDIDGKLKENLANLLYKLFPEGPTRRDAKSLRFGSKGSLVVTCQGPKIGSFFDHERSEGGGPLQLIQRTLGLKPNEAREWAKQFLGSSIETRLPSQFTLKKIEKEGEWISIQPPKETASPSLQSLSKHLATHYTETARYAYRNEIGERLFYTLRLVDKQNPSKKIVIPLSYGHWKEHPEEPRWSLKGYQTEQKPLYNLHLLQHHPSATVLIVEGEKTADAANALFKDKLICLTWSGGAGAVLKTDWNPLFYRDVIIWPDNDAAGFKAGDQIVSELRKVGIASLKMVDKELLTKEFPQKWDLADALLPGKTDNTIKDMLLQSHEKALGLKDIEARLGLKQLIGEEAAYEKLRIHEVLWRLEERMRPQLEVEFGNKPWEINNALLKEFSILNGMREELTKKMSYQVMLYRAHTGKEPSQIVLDRMKEVIVEVGNLNAEKNASEFHVDKCITYAIENQVKGKNLQKLLDSVFGREMMNMSDRVVKLRETEKSVIKLDVEKQHDL